MNVLSIFPIVVVLFEFIYLLTVYKPFVFVTFTIRTIQRINFHVVNQESVSHICYGKTHIYQMDFEELLL